MPKQKPVILNALLTFQVSPKSSSQGLNHVKGYMNEVLSMLNFSFSFYENIERKTDKIFYIEPDIFVTFQIKNEVLNMATYYYLIQILNGYAGLCCQDEDVLNFSFSLI